eukprot:TRINITY_DN36858_c0_g1_i1.p2 TRINITY_DN36858_c0_g1~~TRINITY_DN36858_c0_g1_i1.p2  ORF type:complete len:111 (-),score=44.62 TRINITY_DN36858_c0_g1_i1:71-382(-)
MGREAACFTRVYMPVVLDGSLDFGLILEFGWWGYQYLEWVREAVVGSSQAERRKPGVGDRMVEDKYSMLVEGVVLAKQGHHVQQCELVLVEQCWGWEGAREQV